MWLNCGYRKQLPEAALHCELDIDRYNYDNGCHEKPL